MQFVLERGSTQHYRIGCIRAHVWQVIVEVNLVDGSLWFGCETAQSIQNRWILAQVHADSVATIRLEVMTLDLLIGQQLAPLILNRAS